MTPMDRLWRVIHEMRRDHRVPVDYAERLALLAHDLQHDGAELGPVDPYERDRDDRAERAEVEALEREAAW
jgi:hypothetical protein